jgi:hypothetical protein
MVDLEHDPAQDVTLLEPGMRMGCLGERIDSRDRYPELGLLCCSLQVREPAGIGHGIVRDDPNAPWGLRFGLDPIGVCHSPATTHEGEARLERIAAHQCEHGVQAIGRERS